MSIYSWRAQHYVYCATKSDVKLKGDKGLYLIDLRESQTDFLHLRI